MLTRPLIAASLLISLAAAVSADDRLYDRDRVREREREHRLITGRVLSVDDGDTCTILDHAGTRHRVSLYGCDAPEVGQLHWTHARDSLAAKITNRQIRFDPVEVDREGRNVGKLYVGDRHINLEQVREGYGWHRTDRQPVRDFALAERDARDHRRGIWAERNPVEPWKFRNDHRTAVEASRLDRVVR